MLVACVRRLEAPAVLYTGHAVYSTLQKADVSQSIRGVAVRVSERVVSHNAGRLTLTIAPATAGSAWATSSGQDSQSPGLLGYG